MKLTLLIFSISTALTILPSCSTTKVEANKKQAKAENALATRTSSIDDYDSITNIENNASKNSIAENVVTPDIEVPLVKPAQNIEGIKKLLQTYAVEFDACYLAGLAKESVAESLNGHLLLKFKINTSGKVENADITSVDFKSEEVKNCIKKTVSGISFPESNKTIAINQPINFNYGAK